jgi:hypothetical protein
MEHHYSDIPTWDNGEWTTTHFDTQDDFRDFVLPLFKEPGKYEFEVPISELFNEQARRFKNTKKLSSSIIIKHGT